MKPQKRGCFENHVCVYLVVMRGDEKSITHNTQGTPKNVDSIIQLGEEGVALFRGLVFLYLYNCDI